MRATDTAIFDIGIVKASSAVTCLSYFASQAQTIWTNTSSTFGRTEFAPTAAEVLPRSAATRATRQYSWRLTRVAGIWITSIASRTIGTTSHAAT